MFLALLMLNFLFKGYIEEINLIHSKLDVDAMQTTKMLADAHFYPGMLYKKRDEEEKAIEHLEKALELSKQCDGEKSSRVATIDDTLGMLYASRNEFTIAKKHFSSAYHIYETTIGRDDLTTSDCAFRLGKVLEELESNLSLDFFKESLRVHRLNMTEDDERVAELLFCCGRFHLKNDDRQEDAAKCFEEALDIRKRLLGDCSEVAETSYYLGKTYSELFQDEKALIFYREASRINKKISDNDALYEVSLEMAQCAYSCSHFQLAIDCYNDCLQATKSLQNKDEDKTSFVLQQMGNIYINNLHNYIDAAKVLLDALEILRGTEDEDITSLVLQIAEAYASAKDYENSLEFYDEHIQLLEELGDHEDILADSFYAMGIIFMDMDNPDYELAIEKLTDCLNIRREIFGPEDEEVAEVVCTLGTVYEKAGSDYHDKATEFLAEALRTFKMKRNKAGAVKVYSALARIKASKAAELDSTVDRSTAIECYKEALKISRQMMSLDDIELASMLYEYADLLCMNNEHKAALPLLEESLRIQKLKNGLKDNRVAKILLRIAEVHVQEEKYDASLVALEQVLFIQSSLGDANDDNIDMGVCHYFLGDTYLAREESEKAIDSYLESLNMKAKKFGRNSLECATVYNALAEAYGKTKDFENAMQSIVQALRIRKTELGNESLEYGNSVFSLASECMCFSCQLFRLFARKNLTYERSFPLVVCNAEIHIAMEKHDKALNCLDEAIRVYELFPDEVSTTLAEVMELKGETLYKMEDYETASSVFQECLDLLNSSENDEEDSSSQRSHHVYDERAAGVNHKMGHAFAKLGDYEEALHSYRQAVNIYTDVLGQDNLHVGEVMYDVGFLIVNKGEGGTSEKKAVGCFDEMIRIYNLQGKEKDLKVADALVQKSTLLTDCCEYEEASSVLDEAIAIYKESIGDDAVELGKAMLLYGRIYDAQDNIDESLDSFDEALRIFQITLGEDDINVALALSNIGIIHARKMEYEEAVDKCKLALKIRIKSGKQDQDLADSIYNVGNIMKDWGKEDEAYQYFQQALKLYIHLLGDQSMTVAKCHQQLGTIYWNRKEIDHSLDSFQNALHICEQEDEDDVGAILPSIYKGIGDCYYKKGKNDQALENFAKCIRIQKMELGDDCIEMASVLDSIGEIYQKKEKYEEAKNFHTKSLLINERHHGKDSKECATPDFQIAKILLASQQYEECISRLCNHLEAFCDKTHDDEETAKVYHSLGLAHGKLEEYEQSISSLNKALNIRTKSFGKTSLEVAETLFDLGNILEECGDPEEVRPQENSHCLMR